MYLCREYGAKGIYKVFCHNCYDFYYVSAAGVDTEHDYMYQAADALTGNERVTVYGDKTENFYQYEYDNDYETNDIMHRVESPGEHRHTFVKGGKYYEFMKKLFPPSVRAANPSRCPYCGSTEIRWSSISYTVQQFVENENSRKQMEQLADMTDKRIEAVIAEAEKKTVCAPVKPDNVDICAYVNNLVSIEKEILSCTSRYHTLYGRFLLIQRNIIHDYVASRMPDRQLVPDKPNKPPIRFAGFINREERKNEIEREKENYKQMLKHAETGRSLFDAGKREFTRNAVSYFQEGTDAIKNRDMQMFAQSVPIITEKFAILTADLCECEEQLTELVGIRNKLLSLQVLFPKYASTFQALVMIAEYLNSGRCTELTGPYGAYNMYELEHRLDTLIDNQGIMQVIVARSFEKLNDTIRFEMQAIGNKLDALDISLSGLMDTVDDIRISSAKIAYESQQTSYYSQMTASRMETLEFLSLYDR